MIPLLDSSSFSYELISFDEVDSTNSELIRQLKKQPTSRLPLAVVAFSQTAGRGRLGRSWSSLPGGVYLSLNLGLSSNANQNSALSLVVALGVLNAANRVLSESGENPMANVQIKWPNDIVCSTGKLAGILLETNAANPNRPPEAIVGVGVNVQRPVNAFEGAAYLSDFMDQPQLGSPKKPSFSLSEIAKTIISGVLDFHQQWLQAGFEFSGFASQYNSQLSLIGNDVTVRDINGGVLASGIVQGVDNGGRLLVSNGSAVTAVISGDVTLR